MQGLVIICIVDRNARVALPDQEGLRYFLALLRAHGVRSPLRLQVYKLEQAKQSHRIGCEDGFGSVRLIESNLSCV